MKVSKLIEELEKYQNEIGDKEVKILTSFEDEDGEDRNSESDILYVDTMFKRYIYISSDD